MLQGWREENVGIAMGAPASAEPLQGESQTGEFGHAKKASWLMLFEVHIFLAEGERCVSRSSHCILEINVPQKTQHQYVNFSPKDCSAIFVFICVPEALTKL